MSDRLVHGTTGSLEPRVAALEEGKRQHVIVHDLEQRAVKLAQGALAETTKMTTHSVNGKLDALTSAVGRCVEKQWFDRIHGQLEDRVKALEASGSVQHGERNTLDYLWKGLLVAGGWLAAKFWK